MSFSTLNALPLRSLKNVSTAAPLVILTDTEKVTFVVLILVLDDLASIVLGWYLVTIIFDCSDFVLSQFGTKGIIG